MTPRLPPIPESLASQSIPGFPDRPRKHMPSEQLSQPKAGTDDSLHWLRAPSQCADKEALAVKAADSRGKERKEERKEWREG